MSFPFAQRWLLAAVATTLLSACGADRAKTASAPAAAPAAATAAPIITTQPLSTAVAAGAAATFTVAATGDRLSYQWERNGEPVPNATSASYTTPAASTTDTGVKYSVQISNTQGAITSQPAVLTVTESGFSN